jgi:hypothetical protein
VKDLIVFGLIRWVIQRAEELEPTAVLAVPVPAPVPVPLPIPPKAAAARALMDWRDKPLQRT